MKKPLITVIIPSLNTASTIARAIKSIAAQSYENTEIICVDGGSTDGTVDIIRGFDPIISKLIVESDNGAAHALNKGVAQSTGELITFLNADDVKAENTFEKVVSCLNSSEDQFDCYSTGYIVKNLNGKTLYGTKSEHDQKFRLDNILFKQPAFNTYFFKRNMIEKVGNFAETSSFDETQSFANDRLWLAQAAIKNFKCKFIGMPLHIYYSHDASHTFSGKNELKIRRENIWISNFLESNVKVSKAELRTIQRYNFHSQLLLAYSHISRGDLMPAGLLIRKLFIATGYRFIPQATQSFIQEAVYRVKLRLVVLFFRLNA